MLVPLSWLKDFAPFPDDIDVLRGNLDDLGLVVEAVTVTGEGLSDIVVARIDEITAIEGADKVRRVVVDAGQGPLEIVCGATNFVVGDLVPLAPVGAVLPGDFEISRRKMRGVVSNGMLCSGKELGLGDDHSGLLLITGIDGASPGAGLVEALGIERDVIFDVAVEGNRPDAHSISGLARDLAARLKIEFHPVLPNPPRPSGPPVGDLASGEVLDPGLCPRLGLGVGTNVQVGESPEWIRQRLTKAGMRPINNVVDASNYVMLELGQPTHPYDLDRVGGRGLRVRRAAPGESIVTLDGIERTLGVGGESLGDTGEDCVICDATDKIIGIAGIMGGESSEISEATSAVLLEAASFNAIALTRTSRRLAHRTEAAARFQKGTDAAILETAIARFFELLAMSSSKLVVAPDPIFVPQSPPDRTVVVVPLERVNSLLGTALSTREVTDLLAPLDFQIEEREPGTLSVSVPTNRPDIRNSHHGIADITEEIARTYGYSNLPRRESAWSQPGKRNSRQEFRSLVREVFIGLGASEAWTSSLVAVGDAGLIGIDEPEIVVANPLTVDESRLRRSLLPGLVRALGYNADRRQDDLALFEIGAIFIHPGVPGSGRESRAGSEGTLTLTLPSEEELAMIVLGRSGDDACTAVAAFSGVSEALRLNDVRVRSQADDESLLAGLHPTRSSLLVDAATGAMVGSVGEVDPSLVAGLAPGIGVQRIGVLLLNLGVLSDSTRCLRRSPVAEMVSRFPSADLDLAFSVANNVAVDLVLDSLRHGAGDLLESVRLFDVYRGPGVEEGSRSLAFSIRLCALDHTLSDEEISGTRDSMIQSAAQCGAALR